MGGWLAELRVRDAAMNSTGVFGARVVAVVDHLA
jgi:hypothetical protein